MGLLQDEADEFLLKPAAAALLRRAIQQAGPLAARLDRAPTQQAAGGILPVQSLEAVALALSLTNDVLVQADRAWQQEVATMGWLAWVRH